MKQQILRDTVYIGSKLPVDIDASTLNAYQQYAEQIGGHLYQLGYTGVAGIDTMITMDDTIIPIIEINGRFTLSTYISFLERVLGQVNVFSRYFKWSSSEAYDFTRVCRILEREGMLYDSDKREGILVYTAGTLPVQLDEGGRHTRQIVRAAHFTGA
ncbi:peptide ligase PGM1-related protein [Paenibacillus hexagrammi]|uniref:Peptide ligase PGM1-related protein n=1 Tax=Paenibacillus hexagrammi TaxID=2908839 RepID=A0ABY3SBQ0_9BACL|nr:peptide ligase PGM1-related protein [Paenibacillus sp. YPD9-1]UJF31346.1 peptide ligase PGM1-related protein [Paenibacillus sp. YPD9-1]